MHGMKKTGSSDGRKRRGELRSVWGIMVLFLVVLAVPVMGMGGFDIQVEPGYGGGDPQYWGEVPSGGMENWEEQWGGGSWGNQQWDDQSKNGQYWGENQWDSQLGNGQYWSGNQWDNQQGNEQYWGGNSPDWGGNPGSNQQWNTDLREDAFAEPPASPQVAVPKPTYIPTPTLSPTSSPTPEPTLLSSPTPLPEPTLTPSPVPTMSPTPKLVDSLYVNKGGTYYNKYQVSAEKDIDLPEIFTYKEEIPKGAPAEIEIKMQGFLQILSLRLNGRECPWHWKKQKLVLDAEMDKDTNKIELIAFSEALKNLTGYVMIRQ